MTFLESLRVNPVYIDSFSCRSDVFSEFAKNEDDDIEILYANYWTGSYEGSATVIYYRQSTGKYYEVYGSHCSCYGLERQWDEDEEIVAEELLKRISELKHMYENYLNS